LVSGGAELADCHEHHVGTFRQRLDLLALEEIGLDAFDAAACQLLAQTLVAEACDPHHALARRGALGEAGERRADLAAHTENDDVLGKPRPTRPPGRARARADPPD